MPLKPILWGSHSPPFTATLDLARAARPESCATGGTVLDVGARGGEQTIEALKLNFTHVIAVECQADEWYRLRGIWRNTPAVTLLHMCAGNDISLKTLYNAEGATSLMASTIKGHKAEVQRHAAALVQSDTVVAAPLDNLLWASAGAPMRRETLCAVKVDVQGYEWYVLEGLNQTMAYHRPVVYVEYDHRFSYPPAHNPRKWLEQRGYQCIPFDSDKSHMVQIDGETTAELGCRIGYCDLTCSVDWSRVEMYKFLSRWMESSDEKAGTGWWARHKKIHEELRAMAREWQDLQKGLGQAMLGGRR